MASCSFTHQGRTFTLSVTESSYSVPNNTSNVYWELSISGGGGTWYTTYAKATVNGSVVYNETKDWSTGSFPAKDGSVSGTIYGIDHNAEGKKTITFALEGYSYVYTTQYASGSLELTQIPRQANITSAPNFNDEENPTIGYSNPAGNSVSTLSACISLTGSRDDVPYRTISKTGSSYTFNLTNTERTTLRQACALNTRTVYFYVRTEIGGKAYYSSLGRTLSIANGQPTFSDFVYEDINPETLALTNNDDQAIIKGYSTLQVTIDTANKAIPKKEATMSYYLLDTIRGQYSDSTDVVISKEKYSTNTVTVQAVDSRGNSTPVSKTITTFIDYNAVTKGDIGLTRNNSGVGELVTLSFNGTWWNNNFSTNNSNELTISYKYKKTTSNTYISGTTIITPTINDNYFSFNGFVAGDTTNNGFEIDDSYDMVVTVSDRLSTVDFVTILGAGSPAIAVYRNKVSLGDKYDTQLGGTQLWGDVYLNGYSMYSLSMARMETNDRMTIAQSQTLKINIWQTDYEYGDYECDIANDRLVIRNTSLCQISGAYAGLGYSWARVNVYEEGSNTNTYSLGTLVQPAGNKYQWSPLQTQDIVLDPTKTYYVELYIGGYYDSFDLNAGFATDVTWISARKIY